MDLFSLPPDKPWCIVKIYHRPNSNPKFEELAFYGTSHIVDLVANLMNDVSTGYPETDNATSINPQLPECLVIVLCIFKTHQNYYALVVIP